MIQCIHFNEYSITSNSPLCIENLNVNFKFTFSNCYFPSFKKVSKVKRYENVIHLVQKPTVSFVQIFVSQLSAFEMRRFQF